MFVLINTDGGDYSVYGPFSNKEVDEWIDKLIEVNPDYFDEWFEVEGIQPPKNLQEFIDNEKT